MNPRARLLQTLDTAWSAFTASFDGLTDDQLLQPGVTGNWTVKDVLAHVTTWEHEALTYLPLIAEGGTPPRYANVGGIDAFNARRTEQKRALSLSEVRQQLAGTHRQLVELIDRTPDELLASQTRFRRRLRVDTYAHYPEHTDMIRAWRERLETNA